MKENQREAASMRDRMAKHDKHQKPKPQQEEPPRVVPKHRQCPCCYQGRGGVGRPGWWRRVSGTLVRRQYVCDKCGFDWTADVRTTTETVNIQYQEIDVKHDDTDLETR